MDSNVQRPRGPFGFGKSKAKRFTPTASQTTFEDVAGLENAQKEAPAVIFIDELDSIGRVRGTGVGGGHDEREQTLNQILAEMDGFPPHESVVVLAATNRPDVLDPALVRPGRFDRRIVLDMPRKDARRKILAPHTRDKPMLSGRAAEKIKFKDLSTGAGDDLKKATQLARRMVCQWGMSDAIGPVVFKSGETHPFLGRELAENKDYSEHTARLIDEEIKKITLGMEEKWLNVLENHLHPLNALAAALLEHESLSRGDIDAVLNAVN